MGKKSRDKGNRAERDLVNLAKAAGLDAHRVPLSGAVDGYQGDVIVRGGGTPVNDDHQFRIECKVRASGFTQIYKWLEDNDILAIKRDRDEWLMVVRAETLFDLMGGAK